jgi:hypothetical protein
MLRYMYKANLVYVNLYVCKVILFQSFRNVDRADIIDLSAWLHTAICWLFIYIKWFQDFFLISSEKFH